MSALIEYSIYLSAVILLIAVYRREVKKIKDREQRAANEAAVSHGSW